MDDGVQYGIWEDLKYQFTPWGKSILGRRSNSGKGPEGGFAALLEEGQGCQGGERVVREFQGEVLGRAGGLVL